MTTMRTHLLPLLFCAPLAAQWGGLQPSSPPSPRSDAILAYDLIGDRTLLFGGNLGDEFWSLDDGTWTQLNPAVVPTARRRGSSATNPVSGEIILYGGQGTSGVLDETWLWNGFTWSQQSPTITPGGLLWHGMDHDPVRNVTVVFGGRRNLFSQNEYLDETWEYSLATNSWTQVFPSGVPSPRLRPALSWHPAMQQIMLFGGEDSFGDASNETWVYDGTFWTQINTTGVRPPARTGAQLLQILNRNIVVLYGGRDPVTFEILNDTWEHDGVDWRQVDNVYGGIYPPRIDVAMTHDLLRDRLVAFGGELANGSLRNDTWEYGAHWQPFGSGCAGSNGTPTLTGGDLPRLGYTTTAELSNVPVAIPAAFMAVGLSRTQWALGPLPSLLTPIGMPNCRAYTSSDLIVGLPAAGGTATWSFAIPTDANLVGETFYLQGITFDPGINPASLAVSNAQTLVIGY